MSTFAELGVPGDLVQELDRRLITEPFPIQDASIPDLLGGRDVLGRAPTGSGKTLAFGIPLITKLKTAESRRPKALVLAPTRELASQIRDELQPLADVRSRTVLAVFGGVGANPQIAALRKGVDLLVATPGRLLDLIDQGHVSLEDAKYVVVDEADRMADMGFLPDVKRLLDQTAYRRQTVLFSATLDKEVRKLVERYQDDPVTHEVGSAEPDISSMTHRFIRTERPNKVPLAAHLIADIGATIVFCRTRHGVDRVARQLKRQGIRTGLIHGNRSQNQRESALRAFQKGKVDALVATDVAARGIHVDGVACVIHFDPPEDRAAYIHRSGRTARAGASGTVISFVNADQDKDIRKLQKAVGISVDIEKPIPIDTDAAEARVREMELADSLDERRQSGTGEKPRRSKPKGGRPKGGQSKGGQSRGGQSKGGQRSGGSKRGGKPQAKSGGKQSGSQKSGGGRNGKPCSGGSKSGGQRPGGNARSGGGRSGPPKRGGKPGGRSGSGRPNTRRSR